MIISNSKVDMASMQSQSSSVKVENQTTINPIFNLGKFQIVGAESKSGGLTTGLGVGTGNDFLSTLNYTLGQNGKVQQVGESEPTSNQLSNVKVRIEAMTYLLRILLYGRILGNEQYANDFQNQINGMFADSGCYLETREMTTELTYSSEVSFSAVGTAVTADGRELSFNYSFEMSESFSMKTSCKYMAVKSYTDPLVVNLNDNPTSISDQKFYFDLDGDGKEEEINNIGLGAGFLALDKNEDGIINNGLELFGALTGDGFRELSEYDDDGNGWIDEADEIFKKLRIWTVDENGEPQLYSLKQSDVGAIYLGRVKTNFEKFDSEHEAIAAVRKSGIFLHESDGHAGGVQHVDFAT